MADKVTRCAIYTRKSTEEGLDKEFNSLEAQREACEAYIKSQMHEGWVLIPTHYNDGGYTGGNMHRPALQALLADIKSRKIDVIVVYKVDRLSRALNDFAQMVNIFDEHKASFVSITQQFNTTTSMGRLTLNILLSFAQFEREVIGERVRDKVAASKAKGMWMGGHPPLGYNLENRKLVVNENEAALVQEIYQRYLEMGSGYELAQSLNARGITNKRWSNRHGVERGGQPFSYQGLYKILNNPIYIGRITHKDKTYEGQHKAILPIELWEQVQISLKNGKEHRVRRHAKHGSLLLGKCFSPEGAKYTPTHTTREGVQYRYYIDKSVGHRIKAQVIESLVVSAVRLLSHQPEHWNICWNGYGNKLVAGEYQHRWQQAWASWDKLPDMRRQEVMRLVIERIIVAKDQLTIRLGYEGMIEMLDEVEMESPEAVEWHEGGLVPMAAQKETHLEITIPARFEVYGRTQVALDEEGRPIKTSKRSSPNPVLVNALAKSYGWNQQLDNGQVTITELARQEKVSRTYISRVVSLMLLAPDIISSILTGTQPETLHLQDLTDNLPIEWQAQKQQLKFPIHAD